MRFVGGMCELASPTILERIQVDRRRGAGASPIAKDQVLAVRRPREPMPRAGQSKAQFAFEATAARARRTQA